MLVCDTCRGDLRIVDTRGSTTYQCVVCGAKYEWPQGLPRLCGWRRL